jgi:hypothetical protein
LVCSVLKVTRSRGCEKSGAPRPLSRYHVGIDLQKFIEAVILDVNATRHFSAENEKSSKRSYEAPFFGSPNDALVATVGLNPSPTEFERGRWPAPPLSSEIHLERLVKYFCPSAQASHNWFATWELALHHIGRSYSRDVVHLDLSPRPTIPVSRCPNRVLFGHMVDSDIKWFFSMLSELTALRGLLVAGSTYRMNSRGNASAIYLDKVIQIAAPRFGFVLSEKKVLDTSAPIASCYWLTGSHKRRIPVFFCGSSPSSRSRAALIARVRQHSELLKSAGF